jgi:CheY-like chemotaxis protein
MDQATTPSQHAQFNLLLIDDDDMDAKALIRALRRERVASNIVRAVNGIEAMDMLKGRNGKAKLPSPSILLIDLNMPRMNGLELVQEIRKDEELRRSIVFILSTSKREEDKVAAYDLNIAGYIAKATAGGDLRSLVSLLDAYSRVVELP